MRAHPGIDAGIPQGIFLSLARVQKSIYHQWASHSEDTMKKHHKFHKMTIDMHKDGSSTSHLHHEDGAQHDVHAGHGDHDALMDHIMDHTSPMNPGEAEANAGPAEAAPAAPAAGAVGGTPAAGV